MSEDSHFVQNEERNNVERINFGNGLFYRYLSGVRKFECTNGRTIYVQGVHTNRNKNYLCPYK